MNTCPYPFPTYFPPLPLFNSFQKHKIANWIYRSVGPLTAVSHPFASMGSFTSTGAFRFLLAPFNLYACRVFYYHMGLFHLCEPRPPDRGREVWGWSAPALQQTS